MSHRDVAALYVSWKGVFAIFHRGYWLVASLYLVLDANLTGFELVTIGVAQSALALVSEIPAGVIADTVSRKGSLVIAHVFMGTAIIVTGTVTAFPALVATQMLWGLAWTFVSGADVAWVTDELDDRQRIDRVLTRAARWEAVGSAVGLIVFGSLAWAADRATSIIVAGSAILLLSALVGLGFPEQRFTPTRTRQRTAAKVILCDGVRLARSDAVIVRVLVATFLVNGAAEVFGRLYAKRLVTLGWPQHPNPIFWYTALGLAMLLTGGLVLRLVEARINGLDIARRSYTGAAALGSVGLFVLAHAPNSATASVGVLLVGGVSLTVIRLVGTVWVNRRTTNELRATVHSLVAQAEYLGEVILGLTLALIARATTTSVAFTGAAILMLTAAGVVLRHETASHEVVTLPTH